LEAILKAIYRILATPLRSAVILSSALGGLLAIFSVFAVASGSAGESAAAIPLNAVFSLITIAITLLPGLYFRLYAYARYSDVTPQGYDADRLRPTATAALIIEALNFIFLLNAYMGAITGGGVGTLGVLAIAGFNIFWMVIWGIIALVLNFRRSTYLPSQKAANRF
jgi:hypothetical protein